MRVWPAPKGLHIEPARPTDAVPLADLHKASFFRGWSADEFATFMQDKNVSCLVASNPRHQLAGLALTRHTGDEAELLSIAVARRWRSKGVGKALMEAVLADLAFTPAKRLVLEVDRDNKSALALYESLAFSRVGTRPGYYAGADGQRATALVLRLELG
ncbi:MAG: GNAT family N-acetyltransferase [Alphaproteobacteria bacterium]|nr:GNAT family N-acetyltransferase [Alphaproteobacteria bacterium]